MKTPVLAALFTIILTGATFLFAENVDTAGTKSGTMLLLPSTIIFGLADKPADNAEPDSSSNRILSRIDVDKAMAHLSPIERAALILSYGHEMPHPEIARTLQCPLGTVKTFINRARAKIAKKLTPHPQQEPV